MVKFHDSNSKIQETITSLTHGKTIAMKDIIKLIR